MAIAAFKESNMKLVSRSLTFGLAFLSATTFASDTAKIDFKVAFPTDAVARSSQLIFSSEPNYHNEQLETYWAEQSTGAFAGAHGIKAAKELVTGSNRVRVGIVDGGFLNTEQLTYAEGYNFVTEDGLSSDYESPLVDRGEHCEYGHGNAVATLIGASQAGNYVKGVADVDLVAARAGKCNYFTREDTVNALRWLSGYQIDGVPQISDPVDVINMSVNFENFCTAEFQQVLDDISDKGITLILSNGNNSSNTLAHTPSDCAGSLSIASTTLDGFKSYFSNYGVYVDLTAFGDNIRVQSIIDADSNGVTDYGLWSGTSFSAPLVTGTVALLLQDNPALTPTEIEFILKKSAGKPTLSQYYTGESMPVGKYSCDDGVCGYGILNAKAAVLEGKKVLSEGMALKSPLADECDVDFFIDTLGSSVDICSMTEFKLKDGTDTDNTKIEIYAVNNHSDLDPNNARLVGDSVTGSVMIPSTDSASELAFRLCNKDLFGVYKCDSSNLTPLSKNHLSKPQQCSSS